MLLVSPLFQALTVAVARQAPVPGAGVVGPGVVGPGVEGPGVGLDGGVVSPNWVKNRHTSAETQDVEALRSVGSGTWSPSCAAHWTGYPARQPEYAVVMWVPLFWAGSGGFCAVQPLARTKVSRIDRPWEMFRTLSRMPWIPK